MAKFSTVDNIQVDPQRRDQRKVSEAIEELRSVLEHRPNRDRAVQVPPLELPTSVVKALEAILEELAEGHSIVVSTPERKDIELTTTEAAEQLRMSRPTLINLLESGEMAYRMVGTHRRIPQSEVTAYRDKQEERMESTRDRRRRQLAGLAKMAEITHEAGEGY